MHSILQQSDIHSFSEKIMHPDQCTLLQKMSDLDIHCFRKEDLYISRLHRTSFGLRGVSKDQDCVLLSNKDSS